MMSCVVSTMTRVASPRGWIALLREPSERRARYWRQLRTNWRRAPPQRESQRHVAILEAAENELALRRMRSLNLKKLKGKRAGQQSIRINDQWRLIFIFLDGGSGKIALLIEIADYH